MTYYPEDQSQANLEKIINSNVCAECGGRLYIYYDMQSKTRYIACNQQHQQGIAKEYRPSSSDYENIIKGAVELEREKGLTNTNQALANIPTRGQLTEAQAQKILKLVYPEAPNDEILRCAMLCHDFGLHPLMKEIYLIPFENKRTKRTDWATVLSINATRKMVAFNCRYSYIDDTPRIMLEAEQKRIFGKVFTDRIAAITKLRTNTGDYAQGYGFWPKSATPYGTDKGNTQFNMAFIRSERNAFSRLPTSVLPAGVDVIDDKYVDVPSIGRVVKDTGEIIAEPETVTDDSQTMSGEPLAITDNEPEAEPEPDVEPELPAHWCSEHQCEYRRIEKNGKAWYAHVIAGTNKWCNEYKSQKKQAETQSNELLSLPINNLGDLFNASLNHFKLSPSDVLKELGVNDRSEIADAADAWRQIVTVRVG